MRSDLTGTQKISELQKLFESSNYKADINVPSDIQYVKGFDAKGNFPDKRSQRKAGGYHRQTA